MQCQLSRLRRSRQASVSDQNLKREAPTHGAGAMVARAMVTRAIASCGSSALREAFGKVLGIATFAPIVVVSSTLVVSSGLMADDSSEQAAELVRSMSTAMQNLNYQGTFVHMINGNVETMRIMHARNDEGELERMISLNGEAREVFRNNKTVTCIWPGSRSVVVSKSKPRDLIPKVNSSLAESAYYQMVMDEPDRVAGRDTHVIHVDPTDNNRYGYRFWIDKDSGMLLRMMLLDENENGLEQLMFTDIEYPETMDPALFKAAETDDTYSWLEPKPGDAQPAQKPERLVEFTDLPDGYRIIAETYDAMPMGDTPMSHVTLSDGMASISVYVEYMPAEKHDTGSSGVSRMGAINAYGRGLEKAFITVVGEVPVNVVRSVGEAVVLDNSEG